MKSLKDIINESMFDDDMVDDMCDGISTYHNRLDIIKPFQEYMYDYITKKFNYSPVDPNKKGLPAKSKKLLKGGNLKFYPNNNYIYSRNPEDDVDAIGNLNMEWDYTLSLREIGFDKTSNPEDIQNFCTAFSMNTKKEVRDYIEQFTKKYDKRHVLIKIGNSGYSRDYDYAPLIVDFIPLSVPYLKICSSAGELFRFELYNGMQVNGHDYDRGIMFSLRAHEGQF